MIDAKFWDEYMRVYDVAVATTRPYRMMLERVVGCIPVQTPQRVLELGCGTGNVLCSYATARPDTVRHPDSFMRGVDGNPAALWAANGKLDGLGADFLRANLDEEWLRVVEDDWDVVLCVNVLYALTHPELFLCKVATVLKPGGQLVLITPHTKDITPVLTAHYEWLAKQDAGVIEEDQARESARNRAREMTQEIIRASASQVTHFLRPEVLASMVRDSGFDVSVIDPSSYAGVNTLVVARRR